MIRRRYRLHYGVAGVLLALVAIFGAQTNTVSAEADNRFPPLQATSPSPLTAPVNSGVEWDFAKRSPDTNLLWLYQDSGTDTGKNFWHVLRNRSIGDNRSTRLRVYFKKEPAAGAAISIKVKVDDCKFEVASGYGGRIYVKIGNQIAYNQQTNPLDGKIKFGKERYNWVDNNNNGVYNLAYKDTVYDTEDYSGSPVCGGDEYSKNNGYNIYRYDEGCSAPLPNNKCDNNGNETYNDRGPDTGNGSQPAVGPGLEDDFSVPWVSNANDSDGMGQDVQTGLYYANIDVDLCSNNINPDPCDGAWTPPPNSVDKHVRFDVTSTINFAWNAVGYRKVADNDYPSRRFGLGGTTPNGQPWGTKYAIPFGTSCKASGDMTNARITVYDPDADDPDKPGKQGFGVIYAMVFERDPSPGGKVRRLSAGEYILSSEPGSPVENIEWDSGNARIKLTAANSQNSTFYVKTVKKGFQYMMVFNNPYQGADVASNVYSVYLPSDSALGLVNCRYNLEPSMNNVPSGFSYTTTLNPQGSVSDPDPTAVAGVHEWRVTRAVFDHKPADLSRGNYTESASVPCNFMNGTSGPLEDCDTIFTGSYPDDTNRTVPDTVGPYPIGTYVCYITSVYDPTWLPGDDSQWRHSTMQCSVSGISPKVQAWGYDVKARGLINTSSSNISDKLYGSWGEYGVLSNDRNVGMASGNGMFNAPSTAAQPSWSDLTFAQGPANPCGVIGGYGCYGAVSKPFVPTDGATVINNDVTLDSLDSDTDLPLALRTSKKGTVVINGTLHITGNLAYPASVTDISKLPRLIIKADKIIIGPDVTQIDPWLIATNNTNTGIISTCSEIGNNGGDTPLPFSTPGLIVSTQCEKQLIFNGPVITDRIYLYRTYDTPTGGPAELFNLRGDNFLASYVGGGPDEPVATTDNVVEVPPRF